MEDIVILRRNARMALGKTFTRERIVLCLGYEVGDLMRAVYRIGYCEDKERSERTTRAYHAEAKLAAADAIVQLRLIIDQLGLDWEDVERLGSQHHKETMSQLMKGERE